MLNRAGAAPHRPSLQSLAGCADPLRARLPARGEALRLQGLQGASVPSTQRDGGLLLSWKTSLPQRCPSRARPGEHPVPLSNIKLLCLALRTLQSLASLAPTTAMPTPLITTLLPGQIRPLHRPSQSSFPFFVSQLAPTVLVRQRDLHLWAPLHNPPHPAHPPPPSSSLSRDWQWMERCLALI